MMCTTRSDTAFSSRCTRVLWSANSASAGSVSDDRWVFVDDVVIVEIKSIPKIPVCAARQVYNYLRATQLQVGRLLHFGPKPVFYRIFASTTNKKTVHPIDPYNPSDPKLKALVPAPPPPPTRNDPAGRDLRTGTQPA